MVEGVTLWFMRAMEQDDGQWICRFGREEFGTFTDLDSALWQLATAATALGGRELFYFHLHRRDGSFESRPGTDPVPGE
jgi:hypothetical protein